MAKSLLDKALAIPAKLRKPNKEVNVEEIELILGWMTGIVTLTQACNAMGYKTPGAYQGRVAIVLREAYRQGYIKIKS